MKLTSAVEEGRCVSLYPFRFMEFSPDLLGQKQSPLPHRRWTSPGLYIFPLQAVSMLPVFRPVRSIQTSLLTCSKGFQFFCISPFACLIAVTQSLIQADHKGSGEFSSSLQLFPACSWLSAGVVNFSLPSGISGGLSPFPLWPSSRRLAPLSSAA